MLEGGVLGVRRMGRSRSVRGWIRRMSLGVGGMNEEKCLVVAAGMMRLM